ncbi:MAG: RodZ domain-containing protein [Burkholderiales bacterium]
MSEALLSSDAGQPEASPGLQLAAAREGLGLSVADVAQQLKLSPRQVEALEADDYRRLPGAVFVRGFIRNYARLLKLDGALLLANSEGAFPPAVPLRAQASPSSETSFPTARNFNWQKYAIAAIVLMVPLVIFEFYWDAAPEPEPAVKSSQVQQPAPEVVAETAARATTLVSAGEAATPTEAKSGMAVATARPADATKPAAHEQVVRLRFARESWVEIRDRTGRTIFSQLNPPGTEQVVSGLPPLSLIVGNAIGVQLTLNEQPVDLAPHIKIDVARLTLE